MRVTVLGSGDAFHAGGRGHSALLVEDSRGSLLVDCGATVPRALAARGTRPTAVDTVLLTHLHGDHFSGLPFLLLDGLYADVRSGKLTVVGPPATAGQVEGAFRALYGETAEQPRPFFTEYREVAPGEALELAGRRLTAFAARHQSPPRVALSWRIEADGKVLAVSGDTAPSETLAQVCAGADLFVCECTFPGGPGAGEAAGHLSTGDIERLRPAWTARRVLLVHLSEGSRAQAAALSGTEAADDGWTAQL